MLPHNTQEHNSKQAFQQQLAYQQSNITTSYDSVNSLTTHNNHYTLLYPDLVQELFNFALHNSNSQKNNSLSFGDFGSNNAKSFSLDSSLSPRDILFFLQIVSLYQLELSKGNTSITYPSLKLAKLLGVDASCDATCFGSDSSASSASNIRATILKMTSKLESLGLLKVFRRKRKNGMDMANKLIPVLPDRLHTRIKDLPANLKVSDSSKLEHESNLEHILRTKLFVPIELDFMKSLFKNNLPSKYKLFFLNCIMSAYRNFRHNSSGSDILSFSATSLELMKKNNISRSTLDRIFRYVKQQGDSFFLKVEHKYTKSDDIDCNRYDKSIFVISINPLVFPISQKWQSQTEEISNFDYDELQDNDLPIFLDTYKEFKTAWSKKQPSIVKKTALNNKEKIIKNKYNRNIDYIDVKSEEEFFEDKPCLSSSEFYNNSSFLNDSSGRNSRNISEQKEGWQELRHFYPISEKDAKEFNFKANREFDTNFTNQLLLKLYIKDPEKRFKNKFTFSSYMIKALKNEHHQGPRVNNPSFKFSCNIKEEEKRVLECEQYLIKVESSSGTCKISQVKKKIAGRFSSEVAYKILTGIEFKLNPDNSFITALIPSHVNLSERQIATLSQQLEAVYGINRYYVQDVEEETIQPPKSRTSDINTQEIPLDIVADVSKINTTKDNKSWHQIRKGMIEELGEVIDAVWFSKAEAKECKETSLLTLTMPTKFMADWIRNNYSHVIRRLAASCGIKSVEYSYA